MAHHFSAISPLEMLLLEVLPLEVVPLVALSSLVPLSLVPVQINQLEVLEPVPALALVLVVQAVVAFSVV